VIRVLPTIQRQATYLLNSTSHSLSGAGNPAASNSPDGHHPGTNHVQHCLTPVIHGEHAFNVQLNYENINIFLSLISAENFLESVETNQNYPLLILTLVERADVDMTIRIAGAVAFKNYVKRNWPLVCIEGRKVQIKLLFCCNFYIVAMKLLLH
jgi:CAS/CSE protein involved in chromosome segregation